MTIGIFYGSTTGNTEAAAAEIARCLGVADADVHNVGTSSADEVDAYDCLVLGSSTWGAGEVQDDWWDFLNQLTAKNLSGKQVALFGCGDSASYPDTFCGALAQLHDALEPTGCTFVGLMDAGSYAGLEADVCRGGQLLGLVIDDNAPAAQHEADIAAWCGSLPR